VFLEHCPSPELSLMVASVNERTGEIGLRRAVGARAGELG
jgi:ABC-type antimicrobial peptide transport system permease subunit